MQTLAQQVASFVREASSPMPIKSTFIHGDGRFIKRDTIIKLHDGSVGMFCSHSYQEQKAILAANASGGGRWLKDGSFTLFKKDMEA